ncbi:MAG: adenosylmethionine--8-amino-7-oxononanoate transaminase [Planctomycetes bacterium]|nr:adenosylmethionine--8-amino-7-oxononanoate transaminase [Planctomycetota bacterium]
MSGAGGGRSGARSLSQRDAACLWHPYTQHGSDGAPLEVAAARGATLTLADGREVIDAISAWWTCLHGHGEPRLIEAAERQARRLDHVAFAGATHEPAVALAEALLQVAPRGATPLARVFFSDDGSTAVEVALKIAFHFHAQRGATRRRKFLVFEGGYHGDTVGAMSVGDPDPYFAAFAPLLFEVVRVPVDAAAFEAAFDAAEPELAAVLIEPLVQGAAGMRMHAPDLLQAIDRRCRAAGVPWIADEVFTGFGRTGTLFACQQAGVAPDLLCLAKGLTSAMFPLAATLATEELFEAFRAPERRRMLAHGHSLTAQPIGCAVALESLRLSQERDVAARLARIGARIEAGLAPLVGDPRVVGLRRRGGIVAFDLAPQASATSGSASGAGYFTARAPRLRAAAIERGVLLRPLGDVIYACPPACTTDAECDAIAAAMRSLVEVTFP